MSNFGTFGARAANSNGIANSIANATAGSASPFTPALATPTNSTSQSANRGAFSASNFSGFLSHNSSASDLSICQGTGAVPFQAFVENEPNSPTHQQNAFQHICFQQPYQKCSPEELRLNDYNQGTKFVQVRCPRTGAIAGAFGGSPFGGFGATNTAFGRTAPSTPTNAVAISPAAGFGTTGTNPNTSANLFGNSAATAKPGVAGLSTSSTSSVFTSSAVSGATLPKFTGFGGACPTTPTPNAFGNSFGSANPPSISASTTPSGGPFASNGSLFTGPLFASVGGNSQSSVLMNTFGGPVATGDQVPSAVTGPLGSAMFSSPAAATVSTPKVTGVGSSVSLANQSSKQPTASGGILTSATAGNNASSTAAASIPAPWDGLFDPDGDVEITAKYHGATVTGKVSSRIMAFASPIWKKLIFPDANRVEAAAPTLIGEQLENDEVGERALPKPALCSIPVKKLDFSDDDGDSLQVILNLAHLRFGKVPTTALPNLYKFAVLCNKYDCVRLIGGPWLSAWLRLPKSPSVGTLFIAWVFGQERKFDSTSSVMIKGIRLDENGNYLAPSGVALNWNLLPSKTTCKQIRATRRDTIEKLLKVVYDAISMYVNSEEILCAQRHKSCHAITLGTLILDAAKADLWYLAGLDCLSRNYGLEFPRVKISRPQSKL
ncbi:uncharacterized protein LY89DRAFT_790536 [Mollisia scopiformis]|uniref:Uncharacterized protein n=1 Tax=Mollisia scopiformis TaxID=149040 RepID=A0A132B1V2_MOLSC|nr:uncharacterized protein LY89DRAFT_790536 [Mollisia scopiformis]KUJ06368.1 hypothetical protein LY89DRAFT_790536 [Mollisia scopiformis]